MDLFLLHTLILIWTSIWAARRLTPRVADQLMAAGLLAWGNIVVTCLFLSMLHRLGEPLWFFGTSTLLALLTCLGLMPVRPETPVEAVSPENSAQPHPWLLGAFALTMVPLALACLAVAFTYAPNNPEALSHHLPRAMFYLGQNSLAHFETADTRLAAAPFNFSLLELFGLIYSPPTQCLNFFNLAAWALTGLGVYRLCRLCACSANLALLACWLVLATTPVLARATATSHDLPVAAGLLGTLIFFLQWKQCGRIRDAMLAGLAAGLTVGSNSASLLFGLVTGLLLLPWAWPRWRLMTTGQRAAVARHWIPASLLAGALGAPFALINRIESGRWLDLHLSLPQFGPMGETLRNIWRTFVPQFMEPPPHQILNKDTASLGLGGLLFLAGVLFCLLSSRQSARSARWFAWLGLAWIAVNCLVPPHPAAQLPGLVPALALLSPCVAALISTLPNCRPGPRNAGYAVLLVVVLTTWWAGGVYLRKNSSRPLTPLLSASFAPPMTNALPLLLEHNLSPQGRINVDSDGVNERLFPLMAVRPGQKLTARRQLDPGSFNLLSRSALSRGLGYREVTRMPSYLLMPIPSKRTAGVEFLATIGTGPSARDYFGVVPEAGAHVPVDSSRFVLITLSAGPGGTREPRRMRLQVQGLNPEDQARLVVQGQANDSQTPGPPLATFTANGEALILVDKNCWQLLFRAFDAGTDTEIGSSAIPYLTQGIDTAQPIDRSQPTNDSSLFVADLVLSRTTTILACDGLLPTEGPFPQWDLPYIRWARQPAIQLKIPPVPHLARLELAFSVRLHTRENGAMEVRLNGHVVHTCRLSGRTTWLDQTLELTPQPGENILEFKDVSLKHEPDWQDYLERYPDVKKHLVTNNLPLEQGAREHFVLFGRAEGRTMLTVDAPAPPPDSYYFMFRNIRLEGFKSP